jgi:hypothetical protein
MCACELGLHMHAGSVVYSHKLAQICWTPNAHARSHALDSPKLQLWDGVFSSDAHWVCPKPFLNNIQTLLSGILVVCTSAQLMHSCPLRVFILVVRNSTGRFYVPSARNKAN